MWTILLLGATLLFMQARAATDKVVCYYVNTNAYSLAKPEDLDANLCTHINYAFINLQDDGNLKVQNPDLDIDKDLYRRVNEMKARNKNLKVLLSVGGSAEKIFANVSADAAKRNVFVTSAKYYLETYGFDGLDLDWEVPRANDKENFLLLLQDLRSEFKENNWLLTAAVAAIPSAGYNVPEVSKLLDIINLMTYDFYGPWSAYTGQNSALFQSSIESSYEKKYLNLAASARNWINAGADPQKLVVGVAFYGRAFTLKDPAEHGLHAPIIGAGTKKTATYYQICKNYDAWTRVWDDEQKNSIKYLDDQWLGYDDKQSITLKAEHIVNSTYGGIMIWHIGGDDLHGECGSTNQTLLTVINEIVRNGIE